MKRTEHGGLITNDFLEALEDALDELAEAERLERCKDTVEKCEACGIILHEPVDLVYGRIHGTPTWGTYCAACYLLLGTGAGWRLPGPRHSPQLRRKDPR
jgi:hypothetical protein